MPVTADWRWIDFINIIAIVVSPILAVAISVWLQDKLEEKRKRFEVFRTLISERHNFINENTVKAYNSIELLFHDCPDIRTKYREFFDLTLQQGREPEYGKKNLELLRALAVELGYKNSIDSLDLDRIYSPRGLADARAKQLETTDALLQFLKSGVTSKLNDTEKK